MTDYGGDNFDFLLQLTKVLTSECRSSRQETDKIELLLKRVAKQAGISYSEFSKPITGETQNKYDSLCKPTERETLIQENYQLLYQIEQQEYIQKKIWHLINNINEHLNSIKSFIVEQKLNRALDLDTFMCDNFGNKINALQSNITVLRTSGQISKENIEDIINKFRILYKTVDWDSIRRDSTSYKNLINKINRIEEEYNIKLIDL
ncbi:hypothetical protein KAFR_0C04100 [Kazachstania africana CBS 2517]|uniref:Uncharacterized protein n=1 Tax=Kazachstania africana (strain ATCC 22294 / BCRC 22015 / CBS 2517 / CECT 1963 / NBRC 1671 / NRRL Y-8276) TaxID=1071382 RepID=H2ASQ1_KAZAF|nr:hypothetical protein KAFR_0C04100 [Kazachstania africana CBS 2517]CCF57401.1 hypothetical protein KAFR_0C04100 [Kazachstania africana CBS 2517]